MVKLTNRSRTAHELGQVPRDLGSAQNLLDTPSVPELRIWVIHRVLMILGG
jgi:hypothetical protein